MKKLTVAKLQAELDLIKSSRGYTLKSRGGQDIILFKKYFLE